MKSIIKIGKALLLFTLVLALTSCTSSVATSNTAEPTKESVDLVIEAVSLMDSIKYKDARKLLAEKYEVIKDYDFGLNAYGLLEYHIFEDYDKAEELYKRAIKINPENPSHYSGLARVYEAKEQYKKAVQYYEKAAKNTVSYNNVPLNPKLSQAYKDMGKCYIKLNDKNKAVKVLEKAKENNPYSIIANALLHKLYVEAEEYGKAYEVWKNDNLIDESGEHVYEGILKWNVLYKNGVESKADRTHLDWAGIYETLVLYDEAAAEYKKALDKDPGNEAIQNKLNEMECYLSFRDELQNLLDDYYRERCINGIGEETTFYKRIKPAYEIIAPLFPKADTGTISTSAWIDKLNKEIEKRFNVRIKDIKANGSMLGMHFGRIIDSSVIHYSLWGEEIDLNVITLKNMVTNGLDYWRKMEGGGVGGWSGSTTEIVRVIKDNDNDNKLLIASLYNEDAREDFMREFMGSQTSEEKGEERDPLELYFSPGIKMQFINKQIYTEVEKAKAIGISDKELQGYIFDRFEKDFAVKTNIFVHESQHSIDSSIGIVFKWLGESEYRPKVSQLAYGSMPFMSLNEFYDASIGIEINNTHAMANTQIFKDIVQYIYDNPHRFPQIDVKRNILAQLCELSEEDLKSIGIDIFENRYPDEKYS